MRLLLCILLTTLLGSASWASPAEGPSSVDLRFRMRDGRRVRVIPEPGRQLGQSCVGWAVAYAAKSYQEALDQGWIPDRPGRIFSPAFLYNQINGGVDQGSSLSAALRVIVEQGCATLATMPATGDPSVRPDAEARREAARYRASGYRQLGTGLELRRALQCEQVVLLAIRTNPLFHEPTYTIYDARLHARGEAIRDPNAPHASHALCLVGYDDRRRAFLAQNSWGTRWRDWDRENPGIVWLSYDLFDRIGGSRQDFAQEAYVLDDLRQRVDRRTPVARVEPVVPDRSTLTLAQDDRFWGMRDGRPYWEWTVRLDAPRSLLQEVSSVTYHLHPSFPDPDRTVRAAAGDAFAYTTRGWGTFPLRATVRFGDGSTESLSIPLRFRSPVLRGR